MNAKKYTENKINVTVRSEEMIIRLVESYFNLANEFHKQNKIANYDRLANILIEKENHIKIFNKSLEVLWKKVAEKNNIC